MKTGTSWKTTLFGILAALGLGITQVPSLNNNAIVQKIAVVLQVAGVAGLGVNGKDSNVTGGDTKLSGA